MRSAAGIARASEAASDEDAGAVSEASAETGEDAPEEPDDLYGRAYWVRVALRHADHGVELDQLAGVVAVGALHILEVTAHLPLPLGAASQQVNRPPCKLPQPQRGTAVGSRHTVRQPNVLAAHPCYFVYQASA